MNYKITSVFLALIILSNLTACRSLSQARSNNNIFVSETKSSETPSLENKQMNKIEKATIPLPEILIGGVDVKNGVFVRDNNSIWTQDAEIYNELKEKRRFITEKMEVDVMNCGGYIGSAVAEYSKSWGGWMLKIIPDTIAPDAAGKIIKCAADTDGDVQSYAMAIAPRDETRKNVKIEKEPDFEKIFFSLPIEIQRWAESDGKKLLKNKTLIKDSFGEGWTDLNGDGEIDLVVISGRCLPKDEPICEKVMRLVGSKWKQIARIEPI